MKRSALDSDPLRGLRHDFKGARIDDNHDLSGLSMSTLGSTQPVNLIPTTLSNPMHNVNAQEQLPLTVQQQMYHQTYSQAPIQSGLLANGHEALSNSPALTNGLANQLAREQQQHAQLAVNSIMEGSTMLQDYVDGFPSPTQFDTLLNEYILSLSPKKRDKALIPQKRYDNILSVLKDPKCTTIESAQFRFWAKKMFRLGSGNNTAENSTVVCHEGKPVAVREHLYQVLTNAHGACQHGGRDKTSAQVRKFYSWVPKELIARFVRNCPTCVTRRNPMGYDVSQSAASRPNQHTQNAPPVSSPPVSAAAIASAIAAYSSAHTASLMATSGLSPVQSRRGQTMSPLSVGSINTSHPLSNSLTSTTSAQPMTGSLTTTSEAQQAAVQAAFPYPSGMAGVESMNRLHHGQGFHIDPRMYAVTGAD